MQALTRRPYRSRTESIGIIREILAHGPLSTPQVCGMARLNRNTVLSWLGEAEKAGKIRRVTGPGQKPIIWALPGPIVVADAPPEGPRPFEDLVRKMKPGRWHSAMELSAFRDQLAPAVEADLLETCRRWYVNRRGRPATLYKLTLGGEMIAGHEPDGWGWSLENSRAHTNPLELVD